MTDVVYVAIISAIPGTVAAVLGYFNRRNLKEAKVQISEAKGDIVEVGKQINGRMNEQIELTKQISFAAGAAQEKKDEQGKQDTAKRKSIRTARLNER
jgi:hypothetical protein